MWYVQHTSVSLMSRIYPVIYIYNFSMYVCIFSVSCVLCLMVLYVFAQWYFVGPLLVHVMPC